MNRLRYLVAWARVAYLDWRIARMMRRTFGLTPMEVRAALRRMPRS